MWRMAGSGVYFSMSSHLLSLYQEGNVLSPNEAPFSRIATRSEQVQKLQVQKNFDIILYGAGLTNALIAHEAALHGFSVLMLDSKSVASGAVSWDFHSILNLFNAPLNVLRARRVIHQLRKGIAPHLIAPIRIDIDHSRLSLRSLINRFTSLYKVDERLLIREYILAARQEGATILDEISFEHVEVESKSGCYIVQFRDPSSDKVLRARGGGLVLDPSCEHLPESALGTPILSVPKGEGEILFRRFRGRPVGVPSLKSCSCFEFADGSKVAVIKRSPELYEGAIAFKGKAIPSETVDSIFAAAFEAIGWDMESTVCSRSVIGSSSPVYEIVQQKGIFYFRHRAPWDAWRSARKIVSIMLSYRTPKGQNTKCFSRPLPGAELGGEIMAFRASARGAGISEKTIEQCIRRWRGRVRYIAEYPNGLYELVPGVLRGEIDMAVLGDQALSVENVVNNALDLSLQEFSHGERKAIRERIDALLETYGSGPAVAPENS